MAKVERSNGWKILHSFNVNDPIVRAIQEMQMLVVLRLSALRFLLVLCVGFEVELEVIEQIVGHADFLKQMALLHEVDIG